MGFMGSLKESINYACKPPEPLIKSKEEKNTANAQINSHSRFENAAPRICTKCGFIGIGKLLNKGHFLVEIIVWLVALNWFILLFPLIVAIMFSLWRRIGRKHICSDCGGFMIPTSSPFGKALLASSIKNAPK